MKVQDYRLQVENEIAAASEAAGPVAIAAAPVGETDWAAMIAVLANDQASSEERRSAIHTLQAGAFLGARFDAARPDFIAALQKAAVDPADEKLRHSALDALSNLDDDFAREKLVSGLENEKEALVPPAVALGLLARDDHASASGLAARVIESDAGRHEKEQAVRLLAADPKARDLLAQLMQDKEAFKEVRRASAAALHGLNPELFFAKAQAILADKSDFADIRKTLQAALDRAESALESSPPEQKGLWASVIAWLRGLLPGKA